MKTILLIPSLLLVLGSCAPKVQVDARQNVRFDKYQTYAWMEADVTAGKNPVYYNDIATQNVEHIVDGTLAEKGLRRDETNPDLLVGYHFFVENKTRTVSDPAPFYGPYYGWGRWGWRGWGPGWWGWNGGFRQYRQEQYKSGTVVVDIVDANTRKLVWRGAVQDAITNPNRIGPELTRELNRILEKYPERNT
jgi:hypothetical protein